MIRNYLTTALRFLRNNKIFAAINLAGLSVALSASFIILLYVINEFSYNDCHKNRNNIYRVLNNYIDFRQVMAGTPYVLSATLKDEFPQIVEASVARPVSLTILIGEESIPVRSTIASTSDIFNIFTIPVIRGNSREGLLEDINSLVISSETAEKYLPGIDPLGKEIKCLVNGKENTFVVSGVFKTIPLNSTFRPDCLINSKWTLGPINEAFKVANAETNWTFDFWNTWILLAEGTDPDVIASQFPGFMKKHVSEDPHNLFLLQNLNDVYLRSENVANTGLRGNIKNVKLFSLIAFLIVIVAAGNYIILSTAVSSSRAREIGIRKTFGAKNGHISKQLLSESIIIVLLVLPVALLLARFGLDPAGKLFQTRLSVINSNIPLYIAVYFLVICVIGILSGLYTSSYLSSLKIMDILKTKIQTGSKKHRVRAGLITLQLIIFCTFVSSTLIIRSQYNYAIRKDPGHFVKDVLLVDLGRYGQGYSSFINNIRSSPNIIMAAGIMQGLPMQGSMSSMYPNFENPETKVKVEGMAVGFHLISTMGIPVIAGREFSEEFGSDLTQSCVLNETAVKALGITDPIGKKLGDLNIIGIVKDFNLHSIHTAIPPISITMTDRYIEQVAVHYKPGTLDNVLPFLESEWKKAFPGRPFSYTTIESLISGLYSSEKKLNTIVTISALFTMLIAASGLFGLILFISRSRTKEIGVRKVFGSSGKAIIYSFLRTNMILVLAANIISVPVTLYFMNRWLGNFAFKTEISPSVFIFSFIASALVVILTVFFHSYKASLINPVKALRYE